ncbi:hypothetical protein HUT18_16415 [Streptomyces sp. NA04227]|uniref:hypothetical protein n=1 Tax=Streptomyces sp. NA04227 TaxID=2742136 RepID=UPI001592330E|nr:hypothetical protein [Streptomyces sp. NA04227]QKW07730.1 hypothetical protein HUT18_16415 [Streptomyces sp. NA04227]
MPTRETESLGARAPRTATGNVRTAKSALRAGIVAAALLLTVGACGSGGSEDDNSAAADKTNGAAASKAPSSGDHAPGGEPTGPASDSDSPSAAASPTPSRTESAPPKAADGTNKSACADGSCELLIAAPTDVTIDGIDIHVTVHKGGVTMLWSGGQASLGGGGGQATFGLADGRGAQVTMVGRSGDGAVLNFKAV